jgi:hypothetical protein
MIETKFTLNTKNIWFPSQREPIDDPDDPEVHRNFLEYWKREKERMMYGFTIGNQFISGWLYWHTVYWKIAMYIENERAKRKVRIIETPLLRDIEWDIAQDFTKCEENGKFYDLVGARDFGKSIIAGSRAAWLYTLFDKSESLISAGKYSYIKLVTDKIEDGLINIHPILRKQRVTSDWKKEIEAGWKDKKTNQTSDKASRSSIKIRNFEDGNNTMAAIGTRPGFHLIDEQGALQNLIACVKDSDGAWWSGNSTRPSCLVMLAGTGGDMEVGVDAAEIFYKPGSYNMLEFEDEWEGRGKIGKFVDALNARMSFKEPRSLAAYLGIESLELEAITILVANRERALKEWWEPEYKNAQKSGNQKTILKFLAYWPLKPSDAFLVLTKNDFNVKAAQAQQQRIAAVGKTGTPVELFHDGEKICHKFTDKLPITEFPLKTQNMDAPVVIWEFPVEENPPFGLYTAGVDPYRQGMSEYSDSLGAVYIFKRIHDITSERYQNLFVAAYVARPDSKDKWNETARLLIKYYNAYTLCENDEYSFIDYMVKKGDAARYLSPQPEWLRDIVPNTTVRRDYGIHRSSIKIRAHLDGLLKSYLDDTIYIDKDDKGSVISETLGVTKVFDTMLLEEIIKFNADGNFDRIIAAELAIALADHLNPQFVVADTNTDPRLRAYFAKQKGSKSVLDFSNKRTTMTGRPKRRSKLFL